MAELRPIVVDRFGIWKNERGYYERTVTHETILKSQEPALVWMLMIREANKVRR